MKTPESCCSVGCSQRRAKGFIFTEHLKEIHPLNLEGGEIGLKLLTSKFSKKLRLKISLFWKIFLLDILYYFSVLHFSWFSDFFFRQLNVLIILNILTGPHLYSIMLEQLQRQNYLWRINLVKYIKKFCKKRNKSMKKNINRGEKCSRYK